MRAFGWATLGGLAAFMSSNVLTVGFDFPGAAAAFSVGGGLAWFQLGIYAAAFAMALGLVLRVPGRSLRSDAKVISDFNGYLIRGCFWAVLLVWVGDASSAFMSSNTTTATPSPESVLAALTHDLRPGIEDI